MFRNQMKPIIIATVGWKQSLKETLTEEDIFWRWSSNRLQQAITGVRIWSELTDVRSVLRSNDDQEESEEAERPMSTFSSQPPVSQVHGARKTMSRQDDGSKKRKKNKRMKMRW
ncbi:unnamed protein product [Pleuronectes platessa]|uniref:Uncharacterized protein n=1 Tax=Pleuronectes platessa TaxID=8262 RepID=A0A9N7VFJ1_PLEPL|nr:unnamed protein product [Pleuronectes platessa]